jgi:hypothetical protein
MVLELLNHVRDAHPTCRLKGHTLSINTVQTMDIHSGAVRCFKPTKRNCADEDHESQYEDDE